MDSKKPKTKPIQTNTYPFTKEEMDFLSARGESIKVYSRTIQDINTAIGFYIQIHVLPRLGITTIRDKNVRYDIEQGVLIVTEKHGN